jgi:phage regulator Rha-like protein
MHSLLRIANMLNAKHKKIERLIRNNITLRDCNNEEINKDKSKTLFKSTTFKI